MEQILVVEDDEYLLQVLEKGIAGQGYKGIFVHSAEEALKKLASEGCFAVIVSDYQLPEMDGIQFLARTSETLPDAMRIMISGKADLETAVKAINEGKIFRFLLKPFRVKEFLKVIDDAFEQRRLIRAEKELMEKTLGGCVRILIEMLSLSNPKAFGLAGRLRPLVGTMAASYSSELRTEAELAAVLSQIGIISLPYEVWEKASRGVQLTEKEQLMVDAHPAVAQRLLENIPRLEKIAEFVGLQKKNFDGSGPPSDFPISGEKIPLISRLLKVAIDFEELKNQHGDEQIALNEIKTTSGKYDPGAVKALEYALKALKERFVLSILPLEKVFPGAILMDDVVAVDGAILVGKWQEVTSLLKLRLSNFLKSGRLVNSFKVFQPRE